MTDGEIESVPCATVKTYLSGKNWNKIFHIFHLDFFSLCSALMEIQPPPIKMSPSPPLSNSAVVVSPETLSSHHSSPAKTSRIFNSYQQPPPATTHHLQQHHQVIDETSLRTKMPLSISSHHQLTSSAIATPGDPPHSSISGLSGMHSDVCFHFLFRVLFHASSIRSQFIFFFVWVCSLLWIVKCVKVR